VRFNQNNQKLSKSDKLNGKRTDWLLFRRDIVCDSLQHQLRNVYLDLINLEF